MPSLTSPQHQSYLDSFINYELSPNLISDTTLKLDRVRVLLKAMGDPQDQLKMIHVAGSKGKGSTCALISEILKASGHKVGLYTSPHIYHVRERIRVLDTMNDSSTHELLYGCISENNFDQLIEKWKPTIEKLRENETSGRLTYYEVMTCLAFCYFHEQDVDWVVVETGLGGRLDATNVVNSLICVITPISHEHTQILGETLDKIAVEKAAIIKNKDQKVVLAQQEQIPLAVLCQRCTSFGIKPFIVGQDSEIFKDDLEDHKQIFHIRTQEETKYNLKLSLLGWHQLNNAACALGVVDKLKELNVSISDDAIKKAMLDVVWPGRFDVFQLDQVVCVLDCAHNKESIEVLVNTFKDIYPDKSATVVFGCSNDKNAQVMLKTIDEITDQFVLTQSKHPRSLNLKNINPTDFTEGKNVFKADSTNEAFAEGLKYSLNNRFLLVTGSIFVVSEIRKLITTLKDEDVSI